MSEGGRSLRVFISYARKDCSPFAEELLAGLEAAGFDAFLDRHDINAGEPWEDRLRNLIQQADTVVVVLSPESVASMRCAWEVDLAHSLSKRLLPVVAIEVPEAQTPDKLKRLNYIFFSRGLSFGAALRDLSVALRTDLAWVREHTRLAELSLRWTERQKPAELLLRGSELEGAKAWLLGWKAGAPETTAHQRDLINESEAAERLRLSAERKQLDEIARAQAESKRALTRSWRIMIASVIVIVILSGVLAFSYRRLFQTRTELAGTQAQLTEKRTQLDEKTTQLDERTTQLADAQRKLEAAAKTPSTGAAQALVQQARVALGWNIDVFFCGGSAGAANQANAQGIAQLLTAEQVRQSRADAASPDGLSFAVGRVQVRELNEATNARTGYQIHSNVIRADANELGEAEALRKFVAARHGLTLGDTRSGMGTSHYLSAFLCAAR